MNTKAKLVSALDELLLELKDGTVKPDGTVDDEFGVYFAGQERGTGEKDSKEEVGLLIALERHYSGVTDNQLNYFGSLLAQMKNQSNLAQICWLACRLQAGLHCGHTGWLLRRLH